MHKPVVITADSTCDMSPELLERYGVKLTSLGIVIAEEHFIDGITIDPDMIYEHYNKAGILPKTTAVPPWEYSDFFKKFTDEGFAVVHLSLSSKISATYQNACLAAEELDHVHVVDSLNLCTGMGLLVIKACELRDAGHSAEDIAAAVRDMRPLVRTSFILTNLEFLAKGGRCSSLTAMGANLLSIRPSIEMKEGELSVGKKYRGNIQSCYEQYVLSKLGHSDRLDTDRVFFSHSGVSEEVIESLTKLIRENSDFKELHITRAGCTISSHCGPGTVAVIYMEKPGE